VSLKEKIATGMYVAWRECREDRKVSEKNLATAGDFLSKM